MVKTTILKSLIVHESNETNALPDIVLTDSLSSLTTLNVQWGLLWSKACDGGRDPFPSLSLSFPLSLPPFPPLAPDLFVLADAGTFSCFGGEAGLSLLATRKKMVIDEFYFKVNNQKDNVNKFLTTFVQCKIRNYEK